MSLVFVIVGIIFGALLGILLSAIAIRHATQWLGLGKISYLMGIKTSLIANFTSVAINGAIGFQYGAMAAASSASRDESLYELSWIDLVGPTHLVYLTALALIVSACIFQMTVKPRVDAYSIGKEAPGPAIRDLKFTEALGLVAFSQGLTVTVLILLYFLVMYLLWAIMWIF